jgi:hypothetical protein
MCPIIPIDFMCCKTSKNANPQRKQMMLQKKLTNPIFEEIDGS